jgi:putative ABC transport system permease protein
MITMALAVALVIGALTFAAGLAHLRTTPRLIGWNWNYGVTLPDTQGSPADTADVRARVRAELARDPKIIAASPSVLFSPFPQQVPLEIGPSHLEVTSMIALDGNGAVGPSIIDGRKPIAADEIVLGPDTLRTLGLGIGDHLDVYGYAGSSDQDEPGPQTSARMRIVGTAVLPLANQLGQGAAMTTEGLTRLNPLVADQLYLVRVAAGTRSDEVAERFRRAFPKSQARDVNVIRSEDAPDPLLKLDAIDAVPAAVVGLASATATVVLAHVLLTAIRARRRDFAILRVLGFSRTQTIRVVGWQVSTYVVVAVAIGVPVGVVVGRFVWRAYARGLGVVPESATPWRTLAFTVAAALLAAAFVAAPAAWRAARTRPAVHLRSE